MKQIILGTAGHIDHGKTSLIKAVTGTNTDRLKEEKLRGITIELGFASLDLSSGQHVGIVDVPGHEKFVKNMVAGATGIDIVAMIIAADEGVMPQTKEHLEICSLLGIQHGMIVLTKIDMVDEEWLGLVTDDISEFLQGTFLETAPVVQVSSVTKQGIPEFITTLEKLCTKIPERPYSDIFRLPVDRVFSMKGFGTVITGTLISGQISVGETIMLYPSGITSKVRGIQVHNQKVETALAGMRTAINFQGLEKASVTRGDILSNPAALKQTFMLDVSMTFLASNPKPLKNRTSIRFHSGTSEIRGHIILLDREELLPGETIETQLRFNIPITAIKNDRFVLRSYSPVRTIGGGFILNPIPQKYKRFKSEISDGLKTLSTAESKEIISFYSDQSGYAGISFADLKIMTSLTEKQLQKITTSLLSSRIIIQSDKENRIFIHLNTFEKLNKKIIDHLSRYHTANALKAGMPKEELKSKFPPDMNSKLFNIMMVQMVKNKHIALEEDIVRLTNFKVSLQIDQTEARKKILNSYKTSGLTPPYFKDINKTLDMDPSSTGDVLHLLVEEGMIIRAKDDLYFYADTISKLQQKLVAFLEKNEELTTPQFKEMTGVSRKYLIPLIEYFDSKNVTIRIGDIRKLRK